MIKVTVKLETQERDALWELSQRERRDMRDQAALIIRDGLQRAGLLPDVAQAESSIISGFGRTIEAVQHDARC